MERESIQHPELTGSEIYAKKSSAGIEINSKTNLPADTGKVEDSRYFQIRSRNSAFDDYHIQQRKKQEREENGYVHAQFTNFSVDTTDLKIENIADAPSRNIYCSISGEKIIDSATALNLKRSALAAKIPHDGTINTELAKQFFRSEKLTEDSNSNNKNNENLQNSKVTCHSAFLNEIDWINKPFCRETCSVKIINNPILSGHSPMKIAEMIKLAKQNNENAKINEERPVLIHTKMATAPSAHIAITPTIGTPQSANLTIQPHLINHIPSTQPLSVRHTIRGSSNRSNVDSIHSETKQGGVDSSQQHLMRLGSIPKVIGTSVNTAPILNIANLGQISNSNIKSTQSNFPTNIQPVRQLYNVPRVSASHFPTNQQASSHIRMDSLGHRQTLPVSKVSSRQPGLIVRPSTSVRSGVLRHSRTSAVSHSSNAIQFSRGGVQMLPNNPRTNQNISVPNHMGPASSRSMTNMINPSQIVSDLNTNNPRLARLATEMPRTVQITTQANLTTTTPLLNSISTDNGPIKSGRFYKNSNPPMSPSSKTFPPPVTTSQANKVTRTDQF